MPRSVSSNTSVMVTSGCTTVTVITGIAIISGCTTVVTGITITTISIIIRCIWIRRIPLYHKDNTVILCILFCC